MGISKPLYTIEIFERGEWREYFLGRQRYPLADRHKLQELARKYAPPNVAWRVIEAKWEMEGMQS